MQRYAAPPEITKSGLLPAPPKIRLPKAEPLDTLAQLGKSQTENQGKFCLRAFHKAVSNRLKIKLRAIDNSPLFRSYSMSLLCSANVMQSGVVLKSKYCNQRWCYTCNRIRSAKLIKAYSEPIGRMVQPVFGTLTMPSVLRDSLEDAIDWSLKTRSKCFKDVRAERIRKNGHSDPIDAIVKLEANYNAKTDRYNIHFHFLIDGWEEANLIVRQWLKKNPDASRKAQKIERVYNPDNVAKEMFKYFIKTITDKDFNPVGMDAFFQAVKGRRLVQTYGNIRMVCEDIDVRDSTLVDWKECRTDVWRWSSIMRDWMSEMDGDLLSGFVADETQDYVINNLKYPQDGKDCKHSKAKAKATSST